MISAFHVSYKTASKASLIDRAAKEGMRGQLAEKGKKRNSGKLTHGSKQISNFYMY